MTKTANTKNTGTANKAIPPTKRQQVIELLNRDDGATLEEMSILANWLPHSTRAFLTGLKKKGYIIASDRIDSVRRYRATLSPAECGTK